MRRIIWSSIGIAALIVLIVVFQHSKKVETTLHGEWANPYLDVNGIQFGMTPDEVSSKIKETPVTFEGAEQSLTYTFQASGLFMKFEKAQLQHLYYDNNNHNNRSYSFFGIRVGDELKDAVERMTQYQWDVEDTDLESGELYYEGHGIVVQFFSSNISRNKVDTIHIYHK